jgi:hypothetical protein
MHTAMNAATNLITGLVVTGGNAHDGKQFPKLVEKGRQQGLPVDMYAADRGYDDGENHYLLETVKRQLEMGERHPLGTSS